jgi:hypothetical protein
VRSVVGDHAEVVARTLRWDGSTLALGDPEPRLARFREDGLAFVPQLVPGDRVSLHWNFVCDVLTLEAERALERANRRALRAVNAEGATAASLC